MPARSAFAATPAHLPRYLTLEHAATYSGLSAALLRCLIVVDKKLEAVRDGRAWKVRREDLDKL